MYTDRVSVATTGDAPFTYFRRARTGKNSSSRFQTSVEKMFRQRSTQRTHDRETKKTAAKLGRRRREFFPRPSSAPEGSFFATPIGENPFLHTLSVTDGKKFVFGTRSRLRTGKNSRSHAAASPKRKLCIFPITDGEKHHFCNIIGYRREE